MIDSKAPGLPSYLHVMRTLLAKDWRLCRTMMIGLIVACVGCYLVCLAIVVGVHSGDGEFVDAILAATFGGISLTALLASAFGGIAIAGERTDRTADFLGLLPVSRMQIILSKWLVSIFMLGASVVFHLLVVLAVVLHATHAVHPRPAGLAWRLDDSLVLVGWGICWLSCAVSFFGVAWLLSTCIRSGPISACISIAITIASVVLVDLSMAGHPYYHAWGILPILSMLPAAIGLASLIAGTLYYLRRVVP